MPCQSFIYFSETSTFDVTAALRDREGGGEGWSLDRG